MKDTGLTTREAFAAMADGYVVRSCIQYEHCYNSAGDMLHWSPSIESWTKCCLGKGELSGQWSLVKEEKWAEKRALREGHTYYDTESYAKQAAAEGGVKRYYCSGRPVRIKVLETTYKRAPEGV